MPVQHHLWGGLATDLLNLPVQVLTVNVHQESHVNLTGHQLNGRPMQRWQWSSMTYV